MTNKFTAAELQTLNQLETQFNVQELSAQLQTVIDTGDPIAYMESNINWEIDNVTDSKEDKSLKLIESFMAPINGSANSFTARHIFRRFIEWFKRNFTSKKVKKALCDVADKIQKLIDAQAELAEFIKLGLVALAAVVGLVINPVVLTIMIGLLAMMILKGVNNACGI